MRDLSAFVGGSIDIADIMWSFQFLGREMKLLQGVGMDEVFGRATVQ